jgi:hypothetical protein
MTPRAWVEDSMQYRNFSLLGGDLDLDSKVSMKKCSVNNR